ncbi:hypothetical protein [Natronospora cellulosivora (SeqCode)]
MLKCIDLAKDYQTKVLKIGVINENKVLKEWYIDLGFLETGRKNFSHLPFEVCFMEYHIV